VLGRRGYTVHLAEAAEEFGGRVTHESRLPGLAAWARVRDYRLNQLNAMQNVELLRGSRVTAEEVLQFGATRVVIATGARWRRDGVGRANARAIPGFDSTHNVFTPDDALDGIIGPVVVFDDDHYYLGAVLAEKLRLEGHEVTLVTPAERVSAWTVNTLEQHAIQKRVLDLGIEVYTNRNLVEFDGSRAVLECTYTARHVIAPAAAILTLTARLPNDELAQSLHAAPTAAAGIVAVTSIGDCFAPGTIAAAVYGGHRHAREFDLLPANELPLRRELTQIPEP
jgi:dimethylamine/trimethylamine dehydrogenase